MKGSAQSLFSRHACSSGELILLPITQPVKQQALFLSVLACAHARVATHRESFDQDRPDQFRQDALHLAPAVVHQPRGLIWDWLVGGSKGGTTPRPVRRPGDRQDESPTADLTGTWILGE